MPTETPAPYPDLLEAAAEVLDDLADATARQSRDARRLAILARDMASLSRGGGLSAPVGAMSAAPLAVVASEEYDQ